MAYPSFEREHPILSHSPPANLQTDRPAHFLALTPSRFSSLDLPLTRRSLGRRTLKGKPITRRPGAAIAWRRSFVPLPPPNADPMWLDRALLDPPRERLPLPPSIRIVG